MPNVSSALRKVFKFLGLTCVASLGLAATPSPAGAVSRVLPVPLRLQETGVWCSMAAGEMILEYYGSFIQQCEAVNVVFGRSDCCNLPTPAACTNFSSAFTGDTLRYFGVGYTQTNNANFTFTQFRTEIDANRPVSTGWSWRPGPGGHAMNIVGYETNGSLLRMLDPGNGTACGVAGTGACWMSWTTYKGGPGFNHDAQGPLANVVDAPVCPSTYADLPLNKVQQCYDTWTHRNRYPVALTSRMSGSSSLYAGSYLPQTGQGWAMRVNETTSQFQATFNSLVSQGWRIDQLSYVGNLFNTLYKPAEGGHQTWAILSAAQLNSTHANLSSQGFSMVDLNVAPGPVYAATWSQNAANGQSYDLGLTTSQYSSKFNQMAGIGVRPFRVSSYMSGSTKLYAVLWQNNNTGQGFSSYVDQTKTDFLNRDAQLTSQGFRLKQVSATNDRFNGIWTP